MNSYVETLSDLNFGYWNSKNTYFSDAEINASMKAALTLIQGKGYLLDFSPKSAVDYSIQISNEISSFNLTNPDFSRLARIFDLIQAWGGRTGRTPYVIKKGNSQSSRDLFSSWRESYLKGVISIQNENPVEALKYWALINGLGSSFAPKHLRFWSNKYPVLDTRISLLLTGSKRLLRKPEYYDDFLLLISQLAEKYGSDILETEKALFAFSQNYFKNDKLVLLKEQPVGMDSELALAIAI
jgi:hypothetical protein